ncbi:unnamed protein product (macronuclear) [Paramecium tetraurelia]|uniref:Uncharacterized protein n=1 Tax=Paramecium tetraurelia TaxID=5888 RepID=A0BTQ7_PARTE|nr:uncharacterized protein GSPATT00032156001 [Paramecium tetraurelia]CAK61924.1 unnamed protein product [Paramecium tetraurelia]|eukprot:XP_001429322.1 hypothetical protein (macronuclear) [Paramecium tetraurelia strain d4-2]
MYKPQMIENEKDVDCSMKHQTPISMVVLDPKVEKNKRFLCQKCLDYFESDVKMIGFKKLIQIIEENKKKQLEHLENAIKPMIQKVQLFQGHIHNLKSYIVSQLDQLIDSTQDWITNLQSIGLKYSDYSLYQELDFMIMNQDSTENEQINQVNQIRLLNDSWSVKINNKLYSFTQFQEYQKCQQILEELSSQLLQKFNLNQIKQENQENTSLVSNKIQQQLNPYRSQLMNNSVEEDELCKTIVFDPTGKIMISASSKNIKIWSFENANIKLIQTLQGHQKNINCLVFSQIEQYFISGSEDHSIIFWKCSNNNGWQSSQPYCEHKGIVYCLILTQIENQLISGSEDKTIKVWMIDYKNHKLQFLYALQKHNKPILSLSLNESERVLASGVQDSIIIWQKGANNQWVFSYDINLSKQQFGKHIKFIGEEQFLWLNDSSNSLCVFEIQDGFYQEIIQKRVLLKKIYEGYGNIPLFPIIYNKLKNLICLRHQLDIYIINIQYNDQLSIIEELNCNDFMIYGTITNDGQHLIFWSNTKKKYQIHEIQYK